MQISAFLIGLVLFPALLAAQSSSAPQEDASDPFGDLPVPSWAVPVIDSFSKPVHPVIGGIASGGGLGAGVGYESSPGERWYKEAEAMLTIRQYWSLEGEVGRRSVSTGSQIGTFAAVRHMNRIDYFGIGPRTSFDDRSTFRLRETAMGIRGWHRLARTGRVGGSASVYVPDLGPGRNRSVPSIEELYSEATAPGLSSEPKFGRYRLFTEFVYPPPPDPNSGESGYRSAYQLAFEFVRDHDSGRHDFHRWEAEVQQRLPGLRTGHRLTLHGFLTSTDTSADVPYYMLYTLGGSGGLKSFRPDLLGTDGTRATLRGFHSYRFRDRDLLLMQAEYRVPLHRLVHATVFVDSGQVAPRTSELFGNLRTTTGFSLSYMHKGRPVGRMDVGFGGGEGVHLSWTFDGFWD
jgi:hypothetical protein